MATGVRRWRLTWYQDWRLGAGWNGRRRFRFGGVRTWCDLDGYRFWRLGPLELRYYPAGVP